MKEQKRRGNIKPEVCNADCETGIVDCLVETAQDVLMNEGITNGSEMFERGYLSLFNYRVFTEHLCKVRTINVSGQLNLKLKRWTKKIGAVPSEQSLMRLVVTKMMHINEEWITGRKYINTEVYWGLYWIILKS